MTSTRRSVSNEALVVLDCGCHWTGGTQAFKTGQCPLHPKEVIVVDPKTGGAKGSKLPQLGAIDPAAILEVAKVAGFGATKYDRYNYLKGYRWSLSYDALQRHLMQFWGGQDRDEESGLYHLAHAAWHCLALLSFTLFNLGTDDRWQPPSAVTVAENLSPATSTSTKS
jgi:hypothetical protein